MAENISFKIEIHSLNKLIEDYMEIYSGQDKEICEILDHYFVNERGFFKLTGAWQCEHECCGFLRFMFLPAEMTVPSVSNIKVKKNVPTFQTIGHEEVKLVPQQLAQIAVDQTVSVGYKGSCRAQKVIKRHTNSFLVETLDGQPFDCVYSSVEDNIHRKPHHYRRMILENYEIRLCPQVAIEEADFFVSDFHSYNSGEIGGYYERIQGPIINVRVIYDKKMTWLAVHGSKTASGVWTVIKEVDREEFPVEAQCWKYNYQYDRIDGSSDHANTFLDWDRITFNDGLVPLLCVLKSKVSTVNGHIIRQKYVFSGGVSQGLRVNLYGFLHSWPVYAEIYNHIDDLILNVSVERDNAKILETGIGYFSARRGISYSLTDQQERKETSFVVGVHIQEKSLIDEENLQKTMSAVLGDKIANGVKQKTSLGKNVSAKVKKNFKGRKVKNKV